MENVYSFVEASDSFQHKVQVLEETIHRILKQTVECAIFIREYTGHGFTGLQGHLLDTLPLLIDIQGRAVRQTFGDDKQKIDELKNTLVSLKRSLDSSNIIQAVFTSMRTLRVVETIGVHMGSALYLLCCTQVLMHV
jgi:hypothetical protein